MLTALALAMIVSFIVLLSIKKLSVFNALTLVPLVFGVVAMFVTGSSFSDLFTWIKEGVFYSVDYEAQSTSMGVISPGLTILFSILYFDLMLGVGLFDPVAAFFIKMAKGDFMGLDTEGVSNEFASLMGQPGLMAVFMILVVVLCMLICSRGLQNGVEKVTKVMMLCLLAVMVVLVFRSVTLEGASEGLKFYLMPNFHNLAYDASGKFILGEAVYAAMGQAFFTLSLGIGALAIFGSYIGKEYTLGGEALRVGVLDTFVAFTAGLIIFPACFAFDVAADSGPNLIFITLPNVFNEMPMGRVWGALFFVFMSFAALSTVIAVFENILSFCIDKWGWSRGKAVLVNMVAIIILSLPCLLGFNVLSGIQPFGAGSGIMDLEDFIVSNNLLPLGSLVYLLFCVTRYGWGWDNFLAEANTGTGLKFPKGVRFYVTYILPIIMLIIFVFGYNDKFQLWDKLMAVLGMA